MSAWRRKAIEKLPQCRAWIEQSDSIYSLWIDLYQLFKDAHGDPMDEALIGSIYDYAAWCIEQRGGQTATAAVVAFYEHLPTDARIRREMPRWLSTEFFLGMKDVFRYFLSEEEHAELVRQFLGGRGRRADKARPKRSQTRR